MKKYDKTAKRAEERLCGFKFSQDSYNEDCRLIAGYLNNIVNPYLRSFNAKVSFDQREIHILDSGSCYVKFRIDDKRRGEHARNRKDWLYLAKYVYSILTNQECPKRGIYKVDYSWGSERSGVSTFITCSTKFVIPF